MRRVAGAGSLALVLLAVGLWFGYGRGQRDAQPAEAPPVAWRTTPRPKLQAAPGPTRNRVAGAQAPAAEAARASDSPAEVVTGSVLRTDGSTVAGARVVAWSLRDPPPPGPWEELGWRSAGAGLETRSDTVGEFRFPLPARNQGVAFAAEASGSVTDEVVRFLPNRSPPRLFVQRLYALDLALRGPSGTDLRTHPQLTSDQRIGAYPNGKDPFERVWLEPDLAEWLGLPPCGGDRERLLFACEDASDPARVSVHLFGNVPGYAVHVGSALLPAFSGPPPLHVVELKPVATAWGTLRVLLTGPPWRGGLESPRPTGLLAFTRPGENYWIELDGSDETILEGFPAGDYHVQLHLPSGTDPRSLQPSSGSRVTVGPSPGEATVSFSLAGLGALALEVTQEGGSPYRGELRLHLGTLQHTFEGPPYVLMNLVPGEASLKVRAPWQASDGSVQAVTLRPDEVTRLSVDLVE